MLYQLISKLKQLILDTVFKDESIIKDIKVDEIGRVIPIKKGIRLSGKLEFRIWPKEDPDLFIG